VFYFATMELNLADLFEVVVDAVPDRTAVVAGDTRLTYAALDERANRLANHLAAQGVGPGDHVGVSPDRGCQLGVRQGTHHQDRRVDAGGAQGGGLVGGGDRQPLGPAGQRRRGDLPVTVGVRLDHRAEWLGQARAVALDRAQVDGGYGALGHGGRGYRSVRP